MLAFQGLRALIVWNGPKTESGLFEFSVKVRFKVLTSIETL